MKFEVPQLHGAYMLREMAVSAIRTSKLSKDYGVGRGLFDLDLEVASQEVFGYLGPNGAGKTTTIRLLMGMIKPSAGAAYVFGLDCRRDYVEVKRKVGYLPGDMPQFGSLRGKEVGAYLGGMRGGADPKAVRSIAERLDLDLNWPVPQVLECQQAKARNPPRFHAPAQPVDPRRADERARSPEPARVL